jgi:hypothetical protein
MLHVILFDGSELYLGIPMSESVVALKTMLFEKTGIPAWRQVLRVNGNVLEDRMSLPQPQYFYKYR